MKDLVSKKLKSLSQVFVIVFLAGLAGCNNDDPAKQDVPEFISSVKLIFTPTGGGTSVTATATDPDGIGPGNITVDNAIALAKEVNYTLTFEILNNLADPGDPEYNIGDEIEEEGDEHQFFFSWTDGVFSDPTGSGNIDNRSDDLNYSDEDVNELPIGLSTLWTTTDLAASGTFKVLLKHQPDIKSSTSTSTDGETDIDLTFDITVE
ncbi:MAG TPA: hypothetical protein PLJ60_01540 [Chryseolinea sp.]|nr:hypothetical protein [Chryseolinea sp.]HPM28990.1 hypothetical protein [Chryseolinea sp.]